MMSMDKKFMAAVVVCFVALTAVATGTYYLGQKSDENIVNLREAENTVTTVGDNNIEAAQSVLKETQQEEETVTPPDRVYDPEGEFNMEEIEEEKTEDVTANNVVEENRESNADEKDYLYGLSSEAAAKIKTLEFNRKSELAWPVQGSIIIPYDMKNTVYYSTLDEYKTNAGMVIQSSSGTEVKAAADGVITLIDENDELGVCIHEVLGNDYVATYGQIINPQVQAGDYVEAGQTIAYVNTPTRYYTKEGDNIYFAMEKNGKAVDPLKFINYED